MKIAAEVLLVVAVLTPCVVVAAPKDAGARKVISVECDKGETIGDALAKIDRNGPNTVRVSGTCHENVSVMGFYDLRLEGQPATLEPAAQPRGRLPST